MLIRFILIILSINSFLFCQSLIFKKTITLGGGNDRPVDMIAIDENSIFILSNSNSYSPDYDIILFKMDNDGNFQDTIQIGDTLDNIATRIIRINSDVFLILAKTSNMGEIYGVNSHGDSLFKRVLPYKIVDAVWTNLNDLFVLCSSFEPILLSSSSKPILLKLDSDYNIEWKKTLYPDLGYEVLYYGGVRIISENDSSLLLSLSIGHNNEMLSSPLLIRTDLSGNIKWANHYSAYGPYDPIIVLSDGSLLCSNDEPIGGALNYRIKGCGVDKIKPGGGIAWGYKYTYLNSGESHKFEYAADILYSTNKILFAGNANEREKPPLFLVGLNTDGEEISRFNFGEGYEYAVTIIQTDFNSVLYLGGVHDSITYNNLDINLYGLDYDFTNSNMAPVANDDSVKIFKGESIEIDVLTNDFDDDINSLDLKILSHPLHGTANVTDDNKILLITNPYYLGADFFTYIIEDEYRVRDQANVYINVVEPSDPVVVKSFKLNGNYPNPFNNTTTISISMPFEGMIGIDIYDSAGKLTTQLIPKKYEASNNVEIKVDLNNFPSGIYLYKVSITYHTGNYTETNKMVLLK